MLFAVRVAQKLQTSLDSMTAAAGGVPPTTRFVLVPSLADATRSGVGGVGVRPRAVRASPGSS